MATILDTFKIMLIVMLFYSVSINIITYTMPSDARPYVTAFTDLADDVSLEGTAEDVKNNLERQTEIPVVEVGSLVFYSGNIVLDLLLNFAFAVPQMLGMIVNGIMLLINVDSYIFAYVELFASVVVSVMYFLGLIQLITGIRSGQVL